MLISAYFRKGKTHLGHPESTAALVTNLTSSILSKFLTKPFSPTKFLKGQEQQGV